MSNRALEFVVGVKDKSRKALRGIGARFKRTLGGIGRLLGNWKTQLIGGSAAVATFGAAIKKAFDFEQHLIRFKVLLGSLAQARERFKEIREFAARTPFQMEGIVVASRHLSVFSENLLGGRKSLLLVGDAAAATGQQIEEVAFWVGRAYSMLKGGKPFGEAAMRLQEMGVLTGKGRSELEQLQGAGASFASVWGRLQAELRRFNGGMEELSTTGHGLFSTLKDNWTATLAAFGEKFADVAKGGIKALIDWMQKLRDDGSIERWANNTLEILYTVLGTAKAIKEGGQLRQQAWQGIKDVMIGGLKTGGESIARRLKEVAPVIGGLIGAAAKAAMTGFKERDIKQAARDLGYGDKVGFATGAFGGFMGNFDETEKRRIMELVRWRREQRYLGEAGYSSDYTPSSGGSDQLQRGLTTLRNLGGAVGTDIRKYIEGLRDAAARGAQEALGGGPGTDPAVKTASDAGKKAGKDILTATIEAISRELAKARTRTSDIEAKIERNRAKAQQALDWYMNPEQYEEKLEQDAARLDAARAAYKRGEFLSHSTRPVGKMSAQDRASLEYYKAKSQAEAQVAKLTAIEANTRQLAHKLDELLKTKG